MKWFRFYSESLHDPKVQLLPAETYRGWTQLLCLANETEPRGRLPKTMQDTAYKLHMDMARAEALVAELADAGLIDRKNGRFVMHNWDKRQPESDGDNSRVARYRERLKSHGGQDYRKHRPAVLLRDGGLCVYCASPNNIVLDHLVPIIRGGDSELDNLVAACKACNSGKAGRLPSEAKMTFINIATQRQYDTVVSRLRNGDTSVALPSKHLLEEDTEKKRRDPEEEREKEEEKDAPTALTLPFVLAYVGKFQGRTAGGRPSPVQHSDLISIERHYGSELCFQAAEAKGWDKPASYLRGWLNDHAGQTNEPETRDEAIARLGRPAGASVPDALEDTDRVADGIYGLDGRSLAIAHLGRGG